MPKRPINRLSRKSRWSMNKLVTPRRGTHEGGECVELLCPDVGVFRCLSFVVERLYSVAGRSGYQQGRINNGRSPQNCMVCGCVSARASDAILRDDGYINKLVTPRRGTQEGGEWGELLCPDVGVFRCFASLHSGYTPLPCAMSRAWVSVRPH